ncbi:hypothetical protein L3Q72_05360 [Vibrio sp. JC009]|uniref:hypothetical protein n=1 Tax=Vibrio sp. JC009 TaxID=2912314 RepID=UPI0023AEFC7A|nr:hypothetical protein [Vibrio sp. JC009]WED22821.1 hypothetical protein L3Q72_05360 [Vibrio sp. JC009]
MIKGIALPIAFNCNFRGERYKEVNLYFSFVPIDYKEIDIINVDRTKSRDVKLLKGNLYQEYHYLLPYKTKSTSGYEAPPGKRFNIGLIDKNPTTATLFNKIALMPCLSRNLEPLLELTGYPDFYIGLEYDRFFLYIKRNMGEYTMVPAQDESISCWNEYAHPHISYHGENNPETYESINWEEVIKDLGFIESEYIKNKLDI